MQKFNSVFISFILFIFYANTASSSTWVVQVADFAFSPSNLSVSVGDSIKWQWVSGIHTTTSANIPAGANGWDSPITISNQTFIYVVPAPGTYQYVCTPHAPAMSGSFTATPIGIKNEGSSIPSGYKLHQNFPNPFNPVTEIQLDIPKSSFVNLTVYDIVGKLAEVLVNGNLEAGSYSVEWNASQYPSGIYFYQLSTGNFIQTRKMILAK